MTYAQLRLLGSVQKHGGVGEGPGGYSTLSWVRMCGPKFRPPPYNKTREDANLLPISKPFVSWRALFKTNQCFLQCKLGCISTFWQPIDKPKDKFIGNYAFCKNATYIKTNFQIKKGPLQNLRARKSTLSGPHIPVPTFPLSTPPPGGGLAIEHFQCQTFFDPLHKSQNFLSPLNKSKNFLKPQNSAICCKIQCAKTLVLTFKWFKSNGKSWKVKNFVWLIGVLK